MAICFSDGTCGQSAVWQLHARIIPAALLHISTIHVFIYPAYRFVLTPSNAEATFVQSTRMQRLLITIQTLSCWYSLDTLVALTKYSQMSTLVPGFHYFFRIFASFCNGKFSHQQHIVRTEIWKGVLFK